MERLHSFDFDVWRMQYLQWMKNNRSRIMDFFHRQDKDGDGKVTRKEFIEGIIKSRTSALQCCIIVSKKSVSKKSIYIAHRRETSNALVQSL